MGREYEDAFLRHLSTRDFHVVPVYTGGEGKAPLVYVERRRIVAADVLAVGPDGRALWAEVKAKSEPSYRYTGKHRGWVHGVDLRHFRGAYAELASRAPFWLVVCELRTMPDADPAWTPPQPPRVGGRCDWSDYQRHLVPGPVWRAISYEDAESSGYAVERWSDGKSGWLWPVAAMTKITVEP